MIPVSRTIPSCGNLSAEVLSCKQLGQIPAGRPAHRVGDDIGDITDAAGADQRLQQFNRKTEDQGQENAFSRPFSVDPVHGGSEGQRNQNVQDDFLQGIAVAFDDIDEGIQVHRPVGVTEQIRQVVPDREQRMVQDKADIEKEPCLVKQGFPSLGPETGDRNREYMNVSIRQSWKYVIKKQFL